MVEFVFGLLLEVILMLVRATGTLIIRGITFGRVLTAPLFPGPDDPTPWIGTQTWDGLWVAGPWISFAVGLLFWIALVVAAVWLL